MSRRKEKIKKVELDDGRSFQVKTVILTPGGKPRSLNIHGKDCIAKRYRQVITAVAEGTIAALSAAEYLKIYGKRESKSEMVGKHGFFSRSQRPRNHYRR